MFNRYNIGRLKFQNTMHLTLSTPNNNERQLLLGVVMVFAILDHTRIFFHYWNTDPTDIGNTSFLLFFTRFLSYFFAPTIFILLGIRVYNYGSLRTKKHMFYYLLKVGVLLILLELVVNNFAYTFDFQYRTIGLFIVGITGVILICMSGLQFFSRKIILFISLLIICGHNLFDFIKYEDYSFQSIVWYILHQQKFLILKSQFYIINYTILPWLGVFLLGYYLGYYYQGESSILKRKKILIYSGWLCVIAFLLLRSINLYGDPNSWRIQESVSTTIVSFFDLTKYPASLDYLTVTLGGVFLFLGYVNENKYRFYSFFYVLGKRPLFIYLFSTFLIHTVALLHIWIIGGNPSDMIITIHSYSDKSTLNDYGHSLVTVYVVWLLFLVVLYFINKLSWRKICCFFKSQLFFL